MDHQSQTHIIRLVRFHPGTDDGPLECSCGSQMLASEFKDHRNEVRAAKGRQVSDLPKAFSLWRRSTPGKTF